MNNTLQGSSNAEYHANRSHLSSSQLKLILENPEQFYQEVVLGNKTNSNNDVFLEGHLTHSLILEPEKVNQEYAVFEGLRRSGKAYEDFIASPENANKKPVTKAMFLRSQKRLEAHKAHPASEILHKGGISEYTMVAELLGVPVKARADRIVFNEDASRIIDVKTTSMPSGREFFAETVKQYKYELSAALYCKIAEFVHNRPFEFYWEVHSKADEGVEFYKMSSSTSEKGYGLVVQALTLYKHCKETGIWAAPESKQKVNDSIYEILEV